MKFVPTVNCPGCNTPYTSTQLGFAFTTAHKYTVVCGFNDNKGRRVGCGCAFDFEVVEIDDFEDQPKPGLWNKLRGNKQRVKVSDHLEVRSKIRES